LGFSSLQAAKINKHKNHEYFNDISFRLCENKLSKLCHKIEIT